MSNIVIKGVESAEELAAAKDLMARVHFADFYEGMQWLNISEEGYPEYNRAHNRILYAEGELAAALRIFTHTIRIGEARLKMGGFACVTTAGPLRHKGYAALLMTDSMRFLHAQGYHVSILFGIADFYHRWDFASALPEYASVIDVREASTVTAPFFKHRRMKPGDIPSVQRIHTRNDNDTACSIIRLGGHISNQWKRWKNARVLTDDKGKAVAYFMGQTHGENYTVEEVGVLHYDWCPAVLNACMKLAQKEFASRIRFTLPPSHLFIRYLLQYRSAHEMHVSRNSNGMLALVNIEETLECMIPEWESQLANRTDLCAEATLVVARKPYRIRVHHGAVNVAAGNGINKVSLSPGELAQLITGARHIDEILAAKRRALNKAGSTLLAAIFPGRTPYVWPIDRF
ncbi:MAG: GNAT family N-acetyltransferase [Candidatus Hydrogenedentes bacterium]|nr:GNAT family N-acetyltransferase [Candidatus Hydrogenedentota bacterium]